MNRRKVPNMPDGKPADHVVSFISSRNVYDIDGKQYSILIDKDDSCIIRDDFAGRVLYDGPSPGGRLYGLEGSVFIMDILYTS